MLFTIKGFPCFVSFAEMTATAVGRSTTAVYCFMSLKALGQTLCLEYFHLFSYFICNLYNKKLENVAIF